MKKRFFIHGFLFVGCIDFDDFFLKIKEIFEKKSHVANLKVEHCCFFAFGCILVPPQTCIFYSDSLIHLMKN